MKISCFIFGEQALAIQCGDLLLNANHEVRGIVAENPDIGTWAQTRGVRLVDPASDVGAVLKERPFDYLFSIANMKLLPKEIVALPRRGTINFHDGPLPRYSDVHATTSGLRCVVAKKRRRNLGVGQGHGIRPLPKRDGARKDSDRRGILSLSGSGSAQRPRACATWIDHGAGGGPNYCVYAGSAGGHQSVPDSGRPARATG